MSASICGLLGRQRPARRLHISAKARLCSLRRPSEPNTATPSFRVSRVSLCTRVSAVHLRFELEALAHVVEEVGHAALRVRD